MIPRPTTETGGTTTAALKRSARVLAKEIGWDPIEIVQFMVGLGLVTAVLVLCRQ